MNRRFQKGHSGNPRGRPKDKSLDEVLDEFIEGRSPERAKDVVRILVSRMKRWDMTAFAFVQSAVEQMPSHAIRCWQIKAHKHEISRIEQRATLD